MNVLDTSLINSRRDALTAIGLAAFAGMAFIAIFLPLLALGAYYAGVMAFEGGILTVTVWVVYVFAIVVWQAFF